VPRQSERVTVEHAASIIGVSSRFVQKLAQRGEIPGAAKFGRRWTFDVIKLRRLVLEREREAWERTGPKIGRTPRTVVFGGAARFTAGSNTEEETTAGLYTQTIQRLRQKNTLKPKND